MAWLRLGKLVWCEADQHLHAFITDIYGTEHEFAVVGNRTVQQYFFVEVLMVDGRDGFRCFQPLYGEAINTGSRSIWVPRDRLLSDGELVEYGNWKLSDICLPIEPTEVEETDGVPES